MSLFSYVTSSFSFITGLGLGEGAGEGEEADEQAKAVAKSLAPIIKEQVDEWIKEGKAADAKIIAEMQEEMKTMKLERKKILEKGWVDESVKQTIIAATFKSIAGQSQVSEDQFKAAFAENAKAAFNNEWIAGEGAELVFTQFEEDVLTVMKKYPLVNELNIFPIKGTELKIPKGINNITTAWAGEGAAITKSKIGTGVITINTYKAATLVPFTEELLKDNMTIPKYYEMVVKMIGESQGSFIEDQVINGTDATRVEWILVNASVGIAALPSGVTTLRGATADQLDDLVIDVDTTVGSEYQINPSDEIVVMSKYVKNIYRKAKTANGAKMFPDMSDTNPTLNGERVVISHKAPMQNQAADVAGATAFVRGNFKAWYGLVKAEELVLTRGFADGDFEADRQSVKARQRLWGKALHGEAFWKGKTAAS